MPARYTAYMDQLGGWEAWLAANRHRVTDEELEVMKSWHFRFVDAMDPAERVQPPQWFDGYLEESRAGMERAKARQASGESGAPKRG
jgi:hypothetical protein